MQSLTTKLISFVVINLYFMIGTEDMFTLPRQLHIESESTLLFLAFYVPMLLLIGIPAFAEDSSMFMTDSNSRTKWWRGYHLAMVIQSTQVISSTCYELFAAAVAELYIQLGQKSANFMNIYDEGCLTIAVTNNTQVDLNSLVPACKLPGFTIGPLFCEMLGLIANTHRIFFYSIALLSVLFPIYVMFLRNNSKTYGVMSRLYLALILLCSCTLILHFQENIQFATFWRSLMQHERMTADFGYRVLNRCLHSLGLFSFGASIIGGHSSRVVRRNFVGLSIAIAFADLFACLLFTAATVICSSAVMAICSFNKTQLRDFMSIPAEFLQSRSVTGKIESLTNQVSVGVLEITQSIHMFTETSGYIPWTVYIPFILLTMAVLAMKSCNYLFVGDMHVALALRQGTKLSGATRRLLILTLSLVRLGLFLVMDFVYIIRPRKTMFNIKEAACFTYLILKIVHSIHINCTQGFSDYLRQKRALIQDSNRVQAFLFDWYLGPCILGLLTFGYPLMLAAYVCGNTVEFQRFYFIGYLLGVTALTAMLHAIQYYLCD